MKKDENNSKKVENKKEVKKEEIPKKEEKKNISNKKEEKKIFQPAKQDNYKKSVLQLAKSFQVKDLNKKEDKSNPVGTKRSNFLALLSKFDPKLDKPKAEVKKPPPKLIKKDNPFFQKLNAPKNTAEEERKKKEEERKRKEKLEKERLEKEKLEKER